jgi:hypothetical protein
MTTAVDADTSALSSTAPEPGQPAEIRRLQWIVSEVDASAVSSELPSRNLLKLASIDEDALGEEIEILRELEPGAHVIEGEGEDRPMKNSCMACTHEPNAKSQAAAAQTQRASKRRSV